jgi:hypothetical protein
LIVVPEISFSERKYWFDYEGNEMHFHPNIDRLGNLKTVWLFTNRKTNRYADVRSIYEFRAVDCDQRQWASLILRIYKKNDGQSGLHS